MNDDLIYKQTAIDALEGKIKLKDSDDVDNVARYIQQVARKISELPSIDAVPVKHGRWIRSTKSDYAWECSACGYGLCDNRTTYCYDCGARMEERA